MIALAFVAFSCKKETEEAESTNTTTEETTSDSTATGSTTDTTNSGGGTTTTDTTTNSGTLALGDFKVDGKKKDFASVKKLNQGKNGFMARISYANSGESSKTLDVNVVSSDLFPFAAEKTFTGVTYSEYTDANKNEEALVVFFTSNANTVGYHIKVTPESDGSFSLYTVDLTGLSGEKIEFNISIPKSYIN